MNLENQNPCWEELKPFVAACLKCPKNNSGYEYQAYCQAGKLFYPACLGLEVGECPYSAERVIKGVIPPSPDQWINYRSSCLSARRGVLKWAVGKVQARNGKWLVATPYVNDGSRWSLHDRSDLIDQENPETRCHLFGSLDNAIKYMRMFQGFPF